MSDLRFRLGGRGLRGLRMRLSSRATGASHEGAAGVKGGGRAASVSHVRRSYGCSKTSKSQEQQRPLRQMVQSIQHPSAQDRAAQGSEEITECHVCVSRDDPGLHSMPKLTPHLMQAC